MHTNKPKAEPIGEIDTEIEGDIDAFIRSLESGAEDEAYTKREQNAILNEMKVACWVMSLNYGSPESA